jgi:hypothetical protein
VGSVIGAGLAALILVACVILRQRRKRYAESVRHDDHITPNHTIWRQRWFENSSSHLIRRNKEKESNVNSNTQVDAVTVEVADRTGEHGREEDRADPSQVNKIVLDSATDRVYLRNREMIW